MGEDTALDTGGKGKTALAGLRAAATRLATWPVPAGGNKKGSPGRDSLG